MRRNILALSLFEAAKLLREQEEAPAAPAPAPANPEVPTDTETGEALTLDQILERLNTIRSGKSFQDPEVYGKLTTMYKNMANEDKVKLNTQLKAIGAIVQNQTPKAETGAPAPEAAPAPAPAPEVAPPAPAPAARPAAV
jgi:hypothetical protein